MADDIDITQDLVDGSDGALGDTVPANHDAIPSQAQPSQDTQPVHTHDSDVVDVNNRTLRDTLSSAFSEGDAPNTDTPTTDTQEKPAVVELTQDSEGRYRTTDGMFASNEQIEAFKASKVDDQTNTGTDYANVVSQFTPQEQEQFKALPAEIQQFVGRTMEAVSAQAGRYNEYQQLEQHLIGPRRAAWAQNGIQPAQAINQLFALSDYASRDPKSFVLWFAKENNVDLDAALDELDQQGNTPADPTVQALQRQVQELSGTVNQYQTAQQQEMQNANLTAVQNFAQEKDEAGKLKRPYLAEVMDTFPTQVQVIRAANPTKPNHEVLQEAYANACWSSPRVREAMQKEMQEQRRVHEQERVNKARIAGSSVSGGPAGKQPANPGTNSNLTLREELEAQFSALEA